MLANLDDEFTRLMVHAARAEFYLDSILMGTQLLGFCNIKDNGLTKTFTWPDSSYFKWRIPETGIYNILIVGYDGERYTNAGLISATKGDNLVVNWD